MILNLFGGFHLRHGQLLDDLTSRHQLLIAYLALRAPQAVQRSELAFKLWADSTEEQALTNLRKALHQLKQLGDFIQTDSRTLQLNLSSDDRLDIADFTSALDSAERARSINDVDAELSALETATAFYRGDLLPNLYEDWLIPERDRLRDLFIQAMDRLIALLEMRKHYRDAIKHAQRILHTDNLREETYRTLIRLHALNNDRAAALNIYHACAGVLSKELGVEPDSSTRELYERLLKSDSQPLKAHIPARPMPAPLVAREQEWKILLGEWKKASNGELRTVVLSGEAGIGKTRLAEELLHWASRQGIRTVSAACYSAEGQVSFAPVTNWLRAMPLTGLESSQLAELSRLLPELRSHNTTLQPMTESWQRQIFFESMVRALLVENGPLLLLLDDIQWCDNDTLDWLRYFLHFDKNAKILLLLTLRAEELPLHNELKLLLVDLHAEDRLTELELNRLDEKQTAELGTHIFGKNFSETDSLALYRESEGVPLFVVELANAGARVDAARKVEAGSSERDAGLPPRLKAVLEGRLARLSSPARAVIESAAVIGREFDYGLLRKVSELDEGVTVNALDELWRVRMIRERGGHYDFSHDKLREATLSNVSPMRLRWLHQRAGEALEVEHVEADYGRIAEHFERAGLHVKASDYYLYAADQAQQLFAFTEALEYLRRAILLETKQARLANLHEGRGDVCKLQGLREDAFQAFDQALNLTDLPLQKARLARKQIDLVSRFNHNTARQKYASASMDIALAESDPGYWNEWIEIQFAWIHAFYWQQDIDGQERLLQQIREPVERYGTLTHKINYHHNLINSLLVRGGYRADDQLVALAQENIARSLTLGNSHLISTAKRTFSMVAFFAEHFVVSEIAFEEAIGLSERNGDINSLLIARVYISFVHRRMKNIAGVRVDTQALMTLLQKVSRNPQYEAVVEAHHAWLAYHEGKKDVARLHARTAIETWDSLTSNYPGQWVALSILLALAVEEGNATDASAYAQALLHPSLQRLRVEVESSLFAALHSDSVDTESTLSLFRAAMEKLKEAGYL